MHLLHASLTLWAYYTKGLEKNSCIARVLTACPSTRLLQYAGHSMYLMSSNSRQRQNEASAMFGLTRLQGFAWHTLLFSFSFSCSFYKFTNIWFHSGSNREEYVLEHDVSISVQWCKLCSMYEITWLHHTGRYFSSSTLSMHYPHTQTFEMKNYLIQKQNQTLHSWLPN